MVLATLLETAHTEPAVPSIVMGILALAVMLIALLWVVGMGSGRPHSK